VGEDAVPVLEDGMEGSVDFSEEGYLHGVELVGTTESGWFGDQDCPARVCVCPAFVIILY